MGTIRGFYIHNESWYAAITGGLSPGITDEVMVGLYPEDDSGTDGEFAVEWQQFKTEFMGNITTTPPVAKLRVYADAWKVLPQFQDLMDAMAAMPRDVTPEAFYAKLRELGIEDRTERVRG